MANGDVRLAAWRVCGLPPVEKLALIQLTHDAGIDGSTNVRCIVASPRSIASFCNTSEAKGADILAKFLRRKWLVPHVDSIGRDCYRFGDEIHVI